MAASGPYASGQTRLSPWREKPHCRYPQRPRRTRLQYRDGSATQNAPPLTLEVPPAASGRPPVLPPYSAPLRAACRTLSYESKMAREWVPSVAWIGPLRCGGSKVRCFEGGGDRPESAVGGATQDDPRVTLEVPPAASGSPPGGGPHRGLSDSLIARVGVVTSEDGQSDDAAAPAR